jgi:hypothetical protein
LLSSPDSHTVLLQAGIKGHCSIIVLDIDVFGLALILLGADAVGAIVAVGVDFGIRVADVREYPWGQ